MEVRSSLTTEYVRIPVSAVVDGVAIDPTVDQVQMTMLPTGTSPEEADWETAGWETASGVYYARLLVGPGLGGVLTLTDGLIYDVWIRVNDNPETVVVNAGYIGVLG